MGRVAVRPPAAATSRTRLDAAGDIGCPRIHPAAPLIGGAGVAVAAPYGYFPGRGALPGQVTSVQVVVCFGFSGLHKVQTLTLGITPG